MWFYAVRLDLVMTNIPPSTPTTYRPEVYRPDEIGYRGIATRIRFNWQDGEHAVLVVERPRR
jgi:hypothetical protein